MPKLRGHAWTEKEKERHRKLMLGNKYAFGSKRSEAVKEKMSKALIGNKHVSGKHWNWPESSCKNMSHFRSGENHPRWKGGITQKWRDSRVRRKPKICDICRRKRKLGYDHDHKTGKFRGWLCYRCNNALGMVNDSVTLMNKLIKYLIKNK